MNTADWIFIGVFAISAIIGLFRGFVREALSLVVFIAALAIAFIFDERLALVLKPYIEAPSIRSLSAFAILMLVTWIVGAMVVHLISELVKMTGLSGTDRVLGLVFGLARGFMLLLAFLVLAPSIIPIDQDPWWNTSLIIPEMLKFEGWLRDILEEIENIWQNHVMT